MTTALVPILLLVVAIVVLYFGAEFTLDAAEKIGAKLALSPFVIGMLLIGFGTSLPEMFVGHIAALEGQVGIALGSLVGSNIANMCLILGLCGLLTNFHLGGKQVLKHLFIHLLLCIVLIYVLMNKELGLLSSIPLLTIVVIYLVTIVHDVQNNEEEAVEDDQINTFMISFKLLVGFTMLYIGGELLVYSGTRVALNFGVSEYIISSILIAFGTSFPELVTALMAAIKKKDTNLIVGNIIGSNIFNCALILGSLGVYKLRFDGDYFFELGVLTVGAIILCLLNLIKLRMNKLFGLFFLSSYFVMVAHWIDYL